MANGGDREQPLTITLVVPDIACGVIIGKAGKSIRSMQEESGAKIQLNSKDTTVADVTERIITAQGRLPNVIRAACMIVAKMSEEPKAQFQGGHNSFGGMGMGGPGLGGPPPMFGRMGGSMGGPGLGAADMWASPIDMMPRFPSAQDMYPPAAPDRSVAFDRPAGPADPLYARARFLHAPG